MGRLGTPLPGRSSQRDDLQMLKIPVHLAIGPNPLKSSALSPPILQPHTPKTQPKCCQSNSRSTSCSQTLTSSALLASVSRASWKKIVQHSFALMSLWSLQWLPAPCWWGGGGQATAQGSWTTGEPGLPFTLSLSPAQVLTPATARHWAEDRHFGPGWRADGIPVISVTSGNRCRRTGRLVSRMFGKLEVQRGRADSFSAGLLWAFILLMCRVRDGGSISNISQT